MDEKPLQGIRVIDLSQYAPGPYTTRLLCDLGAEVLKIEPPGGDPFRHMFLQSGESVSSVYRFLNQGKTVCLINLKDKGQQQSVYQLVASADVVLESYRPGVAEKLGMGLQQCRSLNPQIIYASLSGYGQHGPYRNKAGHDINYAAAAGLFGFANPPVPLFPLIADHTGAMNAVNAILAALVARGRHDEGCFLDLSLYEAMLGWQYFNQSVQQSNKGALSLLTGSAACYQIYQTSDQRFITLGALEPHFWKNFCVAIDRHEWIEQQFSTMPQTALIDSVGQMFATESLSHWVRLLREVDCCFEPVPTEAEVYQHPQTQYRALFNPELHSFPGKLDHQGLSTGKTTGQDWNDPLPEWKQND